MAKNSSIEWTHHTFNPWWGCIKVSPGCDNCYANNLAKRYGHDVWGPDTGRRFMSDDTWRHPIKWNKEAGASGIRHRVFCSSMADTFEVRPELIPHRARLLDLIKDTPNLDWLLLTKRPHSIQKLLPPGYTFPSNVWLGTTVENQEYAEKRIKYLQDFVTPSIRFLSCEPLLGPLDIRKYLQPGRNGVRIDWVICGGESEHGARPMHPEWAEHLQQQCSEAGVPFLFKQWGTWGLPSSIHSPGKRKTAILASQDGSSVSMIRVGKDLAGRELRGQHWDEVPTPDQRGLAL